MKSGRWSFGKRGPAGLCVALAAAVFICGCGTKEGAGDSGQNASGTAQEAMAEAVEEAWAEKDSGEAVDRPRYPDSQDRIPEEVFQLLADAVREAADDNEAFMTGKDNFMIRTEFGPREGYESIFLTRRDPDDHSGMDTVNSLGLVYASSMTEYVEDQEEPWSEQEVWYLAWIRDLVIGPDGAVEADPAGIDVRIFDSYEELYGWYVGDNEEAYAAEIRAWEGEV